MTTSTTVTLALYTISNMIAGDTITFTGSVMGENADQHPGATISFTASTAAVDAAAIIANAINAVCSGMELTVRPAGAQIGLMKIATPGQAPSSVTFSGSAVAKCVYSAAFSGGITDFEKGRLAAANKALLAAAADPKREVAQTSSQVIIERASDSASLISSALIGLGVGFGIGSSRRRED